MGIWQFLSFGLIVKPVLDSSSSQSIPLSLGVCSQAILWGLVGSQSPVWCAPAWSSASPTPIQATPVNPAIQTPYPLNQPEDLLVQVEWSEANISHLTTPPTPVQTIQDLNSSPIKRVKDWGWQSRSAQDLNLSPIAPPELLNLTPDDLAATPLEPGQLQLPELPENLRPTPPAQIDPELGNLQLQELELQPPPTKTLYLLGGINYFRSSNIFAGIDPVDDSLIRAGLSLLYVPALGPQTYLVASAQGNVVRYFNEPSFSYNELQFEAGIYQQLSPTMYGQLGWTNQQLFTVETGERFLSEHALRLTLGRSDRLTNQLSLDTFYQLHWGFADPTIRDRVINYLGIGLNYDLEPDLQAALEYQFAITSFTQQSRTDTYNQLVARLSYQVSPEARLSLIGGFSFGGSSNPNIKFDGSILGVTLDLNLPLF